MRIPSCNGCCSARRKQTSIAVVLQILAVCLLSAGVVIFVMVIGKSGSGNSLPEETMSAVLAGQSSQDPETIESMEEDSAPIPAGAPSLTAVVTPLPPVVTGRAPTRPPCGSFSCPPGTFVGSHVTCLDTLEDCFCNDTNENAADNRECWENSGPVTVPQPAPQPSPVSPSCGSFSCPPGTHVGDFVMCLDSLEDCFCNDTNDNAASNRACWEDYGVPQPSPGNGHGCVPAAQLQHTHFNREGGHIHHAHEVNGVFICPEPPTPSSGGGGGGSLTPQPTLLMASLANTKTLQLNSIGPDLVSALLRTFPSSDLTSVLLTGFPPGAIITYFDRNMNMLTLQEDTNGPRVLLSGESIWELLDTISTLSVPNAADVIDFTLGIEASNANQMSQTFVLPVIGGLRAPPQVAPAPTNAPLGPGETFQPTFLRASLAATKEIEFDDLGSDLASALLRAMPKWHLETLTLGGFPMGASVSYRGSDGNSYTITEGGQQVKVSLSADTLGDLYDVVASLSLTGSQVVEDFPLSVEATSDTGDTQTFSLMVSAPIQAPTPTFSPTASPTKLIQSDDLGSGLVSLLSQEFPSQDLEMIALTGFPMGASVTYVGNDGNTYTVNEGGQGVKLVLTDEINGDLYDIIETISLDDSQGSKDFVLAVEATPQGGETRIFSVPVFAPLLASDLEPSPRPTKSPITASPVVTPTRPPTRTPVTALPTSAPVTSSPTRRPTDEPTKVPSTHVPTKLPTSARPTPRPTMKPTGTPTTPAPTPAPSRSPTLKPTSTPTKSPVTMSPTRKPTPIPTSSPSETPDTTFDLTFTYHHLNASHIAIVEEAAAIWKSIIVGDLEDQTSQDLTSLYDFAVGSCPYPDMIDDLHLCVGIFHEEFDGPGGFLGFGGTEYVRANERQLLGLPDTGERELKGLPYTGIIFFDPEDIHRLSTPIAIHEMGHTLGFGTLWDNALLGSVAEGCPYVGTEANREYESISGCSSLPIDPPADGATKCTNHFSETCFQTELMTSVLSNAENPLSRVTIGTMADLGYEVDYAPASAFTTSDLAASCLCSGRREERNLLRERKPERKLESAKDALVREQSIAYGRKFLDGRLDAPRGRLASKNNGLIASKTLSVFYQREDGSIADALVTM